MECAAPPSFLVTLPLRHFRITGFGSAGIDRFAISWFASKLRRNFKTQTVAAGLRMWEYREAISKSGHVPGVICSHRAALTTPLAVTGGGRGTGP